MRKCKYEILVDSYLRNTLPETEKEKFEEHYFNCPLCFEKMTEKAVLMDIIKERGAYIFKENPAAQEDKSLPWTEKILSFLTPRQWASVAISVSFLLVVVLGIVPRFKNTQPKFSLSGEDTVRGETLALISPVIDISGVPSYFEWEKIGENNEYKISLSNHSLLWTTTTKENRIFLPEDIQKRMKSGEKYFWQVKAYSPQGTLIAVSSSVHFQIAKSR
ncbi:MAG: zf-HC2 domain-containing protein [Candidatus Aminicenantales bacterium]